eukprot:gene2055-1561_t
MRLHENSIQVELIEENHDENSEEENEEANLLKNEEYSSEEPEDYIPEIHYNTEFLYIFCVLIGFLVMLLIISFIFFASASYIIHHPLIYKSSVYVEIPLEEIREEYYHIYYSRPLSSTLYSWKMSSTSNNFSCDSWTDDKIARIKIEDFNLLPKNLVKGMLTPYKHSNYKICNILNVIPQYKCHSQGVWKNFEDFIFQNHHEKLSCQTKQ